MGSFCHKKLVNVEKNEDKAGNAEKKDQDDIQRRAGVQNLDRQLCLNSLNVRGQKRNDEENRLNLSQAGLQWGSRYY